MKDEKMIKEKKMKIKTKIVIFFTAVLLTFVGFNLIVSPAAVDLATVHQDSDYEITVIA
jgi:hypothetical protein